MEKNINRQIFDYVFGNISDEEKTSLHNDADFMAKLISATRNKIFYDFCTNEVKTNGKFVNSLLAKFQIDRGFITKVITYYLNHAEVDYDYFEIMALGADKYKITDAEYKMFAHFTMERSRLKAMSFGLEDDISRDEFGLGFIFIEENYSGCRNVLNYFAKHMVEELISCEVANSVEEFVHQHFHVKKDLINYGVKNFIIDYIRSLDIYLADYLTVHPNLLDDLSKQISEILNNWDNYMFVLNIKRVQIVYKFVADYMMDGDKEKVGDLIKIFKATIKEMGLQEYFQDDSTEFCEEKEDKYVSIDELRFKKKLKELLSQLFDADIIVGANHQFDPNDGGSKGNKLLYTN